VERNLKLLGKKIKKVLDICRALRYNSFYTVRHLALLTHCRQFSLQFLLTPIRSTTMKKFITATVAALVMSNAAMAFTGADKFAEEIVGGLGPVAVSVDPFAEEIVGGLGPANTNIDPFAEEIVGGLGPANTNIDPFAEEIVGGLGPANTNNDPFAEEIVGGLGPQVNHVAGR